MSNFKILLSVPVWKYEDGEKLELCFYFDSHSAESITMAFDDDRPDLPYAVKLPMAMIVVLAKHLKSERKGPSFNGGFQFEMKCETGGKDFKIIFSLENKKEVIVRVAHGNESISVCISDERATEIGIFIGSCFSIGAGA